MTVKLTVKSEQQAFDLAIEKITEQGCGSYDSARECCVYDGSHLFDGRDNVACAVGHMIDPAERRKLDEYELPGIFGGCVAGISDLLDHDKIDAGDVCGKFLRELQNAHDEAAEANPGDGCRTDFLRDFYRRMDAMAERNTDIIVTTQLDKAVEKLEGAN